MVKNYGKKHVEDMLALVNSAAPPSRAKAGTKVVTFTTIHSFKGLEADCVIATGDLNSASFYAWYTTITRARGCLVMAYSLARKFKEATGWTCDRLEQLLEEDADGGGFSGSEGEDEKDMKAKARARQRKYWAMKNAKKRRRK